MNIQTRLKKVESSLEVTDDLCRCPDALALAATPYFRTCYKCEKAIDISTWKHWQMCNPDEKNNFFAFGLKRDDKQELADKENNYFSDEVMLVKYLLYARSTSFHDWFLTLNDEEKARTIDEMEKVENGKVTLEESNLKAGFDEYLTNKKGE